MIKKIKHAIKRKCYPHRYFPYNRYLVSHRHRFIFLAIAKNANSFFKTAVILNADGTEDFEPKQETGNRYLNRKPESPVHLRNLQLLKDPSYTKIVVLRNPMKRFVSAYLDKIVSKDLVGSRYVSFVEAVQEANGLCPDHDRSITFREFVKYVCMQTDSEQNHHWRPQTAYLSNHVFDLYGRLEDLSDTYDFFSKRYGIDLNEISRNQVISAKVTNYDQSQESNLEIDYSRWLPSELIGLPALPTAPKLFSPDLFEIYESRYQRDIQLYAKTFDCDYNKLTEAYRGYC